MYSEDFSNGLTSQLALDKFKRLPFHSDSNKSSKQRSLPNASLQLGLARQSPAKWTRQPQPQPCEPGKLQINSHDAGKKNAPADAGPSHCVPRQRAPNNYQRCLVC